MFDGNQSAIIQWMAALRWFSVDGFCAAVPALQMPIFLGSQATCKLSNIYRHFKHLLNGINRRLYESVLEL